MKFKMNKLESFEYKEKEGIIIDGKKYGLGIAKVEIESFGIKIYINKGSIIENFEEWVKEQEWKDYNNPYDLIKYENIRIIEE